jgi:hypothetical protein
LNILRNKSLYIGEGELIVGERGPAPKETPTYPEISLHSMEDLIYSIQEKKSHSGLMKRPDKFTEMKSFLSGKVKVTVTG